MTNEFFRSSLYIPHLRGLKLPTPTLAVRQENYCKGEYQIAPAYPNNSPHARRA